MLIGQSLIAVQGVSKTYYTSWFPRGGNAGSFVVQILQISSSNAELTVAFEHKDADESDAAAASVGTGFTATAVGTYTTSSPPSASGLKQLVRLKLSLGGISDGDEWLHLRVDPTIWQNN